jgi:hypothetical protein
MEKLNRDRPGSRASAIKQWKRSTHFTLMREAHAITAPDPKKECNAILRALGVRSSCPDIFSSGPLLALVLQNDETLSVLLRYTNPTRILLFSSSALLHPWVYVLLLLCAPVLMASYSSPSLSLCAPAPLRSCAMCSLLSTSAHVLLLCAPMPSQRFWGPMQNEKRGL